MHLLDYVITTSRKTFEELPFNEVDALVFAQLAYYDYSIFEDGITLREIANNKKVLKATDLKNLIGKDDERMFNVAIVSKRYRDCIVKWHVSKLDRASAMQFSATTFIISKKRAVIAYRGTDGTVVGWNEDMNMTYMFPIPGQVEAQRYINDVLGKIKCNDIIVVGHSKGGNIAVYASVMARKDLQDNISAVYNFDGPGFIDAFYYLDAFAKIKDKIHKYIPEQSSVGRMMKAYNDYIVIKSDMTYAMQHWAHSWLIEDNHFVYSDTPDFFSEVVEQSTEAVLENMTRDERKDAIDVIFNDILYTTQKDYMDDIIKNKEMILYCLKQYTTLKDKNDNVKKLFMQLIRPFARQYFQKGEEIAALFITEKKNLIVEKFKERFGKDKANENE